MWNTAIDWKAKTRSLTLQYHVAVDVYLLVSLFFVIVCSSLYFVGLDKQAEENFLRNIFPAAQLQERSSRSRSMKRKRETKRVFNFGRWTGIASWKQSIFEEFQLQKPCGPCGTSHEIESTQESRDLDLLSRIYEIPCLTKSYKNIFDIFHNVEVARTKQAPTSLFPIGFICVWIFVSNI